MYIYSLPSYFLIYLAVKKDWKIIKCTFERALQYLKKKNKIVYPRIAFLLVPFYFVVSSCSAACIYQFRTCDK